MRSDPKEELYHEEQQQKEEHEERKPVLGEEHRGEAGKEAKKKGVGLRMECDYMKREEEVYGASPLVQQGALAMAVDDDEVAAAMEADLTFSDEGFLLLPDFPCLSSPSNAACPSSSSSSSSSSSAASAFWAVEQQHAVVPMAPSPAVGDVSTSLPSPPSDGNQTVPQALDSDCSMDLLAEVGLLAPTNDPSWEPSSLFPDEMEKGHNGGGGELVPCLGEHQQRQQQALLQQQQQQQRQSLTSEEGLGAAGQGGGCTSGELAVVFLEWLKSNKETISPQDLRSIRLRCSTIECAARNLGGGMEGMKKLLKLILAWVQNHHLQKKRRPPPLAGDVLGAGDQEDANMTTTYQHHFMPVNDPGHGFPACSSWAPPGDPAAPSSFQPPPRSCGGDVWYSPGATAAPVLPFSPSSTSHAVEHICSWPPQHPVFPTPPGQLPTLPYDPAGLPGHCGAMGKLFHQGARESLVPLAALATKEARKKRMARQRRFSSPHHHQRSQQQLSPHRQQPHIQQCASGLTGEALCSQINGHGNRAVSASATPQQVAMLGDANATAMQQKRQHNFPAGSTLPERRQSETNLRFLLQKVLKQSDVGSLGRIVLPKKEAEIHLPELDGRDGISIAMEDIGTSRTWNMRYRFWPNNKSRMYLLENTGDFVRSNGLQEGDFIVIYSDVKCGKYMIRGVKVRQPADSKVDDGRNPRKHTVLQKNCHTGNKQHQNQHEGGHQQQQYQP